MGRFPEAVGELEKTFAKPIPVSPDAKGYCELSQQIDGSDRSGQSAMACALTGNRDLTFRFAEQAYAAGDNSMLFLVRYPGLDPFRSDPRYADLMRRLGLPQ
jgi:hypothetical protein